MNFELIRLPIVIVIKGHYSFSVLSATSVNVVHFYYSCSMLIIILQIYMCYFLSSCCEIKTPAVCTFAVNGKWAI